MSHNPPHLPAQDRPTPPVATDAQPPRALLRMAIAAARSDEDSGLHRVRLGYLAEALALHLGVSAARARLLRLAAPLHDIGKLDPADIAPNTTERERLRAHPRRGAKLLGGSSLPLFALAAEVALHHHERWDGQGFPQGLTGEQIPLSGRIVAVVDHFDALTMDSRFRPEQADDRALAMLAGQAGGAFDPAVVTALQAHAGELIALREWVNDTRPGFGAPLPGGAGMPVDAADLLGAPAEMPA
jgi:putative two-component system response regulator